MSPNTSEASAAAASPYPGLLSIFYSPDEAFPRGNRLAWLVPLTVACLMALVMNILIIQKVGMETLTRNQLQSNPSLVEKVGQKEIDRISQEAGQSTGRKLMVYAGSLFGPPVVMALIAGALLGFVALTGGDSRFPAMMTAVAYPGYAMMTVTLIAALITLAATKDYSTFDATQLIVLNPTLFMDRTTTNKALYSLARSLDLLAIWNVLLVSVGVSKMSTGVSFVKALGIVGSLWLLWSLVKAGFSMLF
jgi:hypothetical protein